ncbi:hypothetical protein ITJ42_15945 [Clavibacter michiganensis subsp. phaseoli]|uniref:Uncharacterized protein n=1 Tax=Clavibacter phaseoli TaxID=1734031 RepID=A0A8I0SLC3_9MICO|nr:hypothetical protein [Clavibacter phaseoli]MBF4632712.1 hypothetical protein [Clavibacter phaseoli]
MTTDSDAIPLLLTPGLPQDDSFLLRFPVEHRDEILSLMDEHGIDHGTVMEMSAGPQLAIESVQILAAGGGITALVHLYRSFVHRHDGKKVIIKQGDDSIDVSGYSPKQLEQFITARAAEQAARNDDWNQELEGRDDH